MKNSTIVWWIVGGVVVLGLIWWASSASSNPATAAPMIPAATSAETSPTVTQVSTGTSTVTTVTTTPHVVLVSYTKSGFAPASIAVSVGDTVKFINQSSIGMQILSNPDPGNTDYPALNESSSVFQGSAYSFTFEKSGTWGYYNGLNTRDKGTVLVK